MKKGNRIKEKGAGTWKKVHTVVDQSFNSFPPQELVFVLVFASF